MARKVSILYELVDTETALLDAIDDLESRDSLSVDCEGVGLSRTGRLCLLQVGSPEKVYLFDIVTLGRKVFDKGLRAVLENPDITKLFYDCREDCNALKHQYDVDVEGIFDLQLLDNFGKIVARRRAEFVNGLRKSLTFHLPGCGFSEAEKEKMHDAFFSDKELWVRRPLKAKYIEYAATDVFFLPKLRTKILNNIITRGVSADTVRKLVYYASARYADFARDNDKYEVGSPYFRHARLPLGIIPRLNATKTGYIAFEDYGKQCSTCGQYHPGRHAQCSRCIAIDDDPRK